MRCSAATCAPHETLTPKSGCFEVEQEEDLASACFEHEAEDKLASGRKPAWGGEKAHSLFVRIASYVAYDEAEARTRDPHGLTDLKNREG